MSADFSKAVWAEEEDGSISCTLAPRLNMHIIPGLREGAYVSYVFGRKIDEGVHLGLMKDVCEAYAKTLLEQALRSLGRLNE